MERTLEERLLDFDIKLPEPVASAANYVPFIHTGNLLLTSGQLPLNDGALIATGLLGRDLDVETGRLAAKWCAANILGQARTALGDLERIQRIIKITVFVASSPEFTEQHLVANGASDFLEAALGVKGRHTRSAVGVSVLPMNAPVEIEAIIEVI